MRVAYGDSNVLRCTIQFAYDRFFTSYTKRADQKRAVLNSVDDIVNTNSTQEAIDIQKSYDQKQKEEYDALSAQEKMNKSGLGWYNLGGLL